MCPEKRVVELVAHMAPALCPIQRKFRAGQLNHLHTQFQRTAYKTAAQGLLGINLGLVVQHHLGRCV